MLDAGSNLRRITKAAGHIVAGFGILAFAQIAGGCRHSEDATEWIIAVPAGARELRPRAVAPEARTRAPIELVEELVLGAAEMGDRGPLLAGVTDLEIDNEGRLFAYDRRNFRIVVFDDDGWHLRTIGGRMGTGPEDFGRSGHIAVAGDKLAYFRSGAGLLTLWSLDGEHVSTRRFGGKSFLRRMTGTPDGELMVSFIEVDREHGEQLVIARFALSGEELHRYLELPAETQLVFERRSRSGLVAVATGISFGIPTFALSSSGDVFLTPGREYQVLSLDVSGTTRWAMRARWPRASITDSDVATAMQMIRSRVPDALPSDVAWPEAHPALGAPAINIDGHGHLYVFPFVRDDLEISPNEARSQPVDVYAPDGQQLYVGELLPPVRWLAARDGHVYAVREATATNEQQIVRYRLVEPF